MVAQPSPHASPRAYFAGCYRHAPAIFVRGEGSRLFDASNEAWLDLGSGIAVSALGHGDPGLSRVIAEQAQRLIHCSNLYLCDTVGAAAERIARHTGMGQVFLCNSGAEAIEAALKLARRWFQTVRGEKRFRFVSAEASFHGRSFGALSATGQPGYHRGFEPLVPGFSHVPFGDVAALEAAVGDETAAILLEPLQGEGGVIPAPEGYLAAARRIADERGCLLIFDEIQTGVGRCGTFLASEREGVRPDIVTLAKGLAGGLPLGATAYREGLSEAFVPGSHMSTFGGNPVACAAACEVMDRVSAPDFLARVRELSDFIDARLRAGFGSRVGAAVAPDSERPGIVEIRGRGLLWGVALDRPAKPFMQALYERNFLVTVAGGNVLRLSPPLTIGVEELGEGVDAIIDVLGGSA